MQLIQELIINSVQEFLNETNNHVHTPENLLGNYIDFHPVTLQEQSIKKLIPYLDTVRKHKVHVYNEGIRISKILDPDGSYLGYQSLFLRHDMSKYSPQELYGYGLHDWSKGTKPAEGSEFEWSWHHHKTTNNHHPEFYYFSERNGKVRPLPMGKTAVIEMISDWSGAGLTYGKLLDDWLPDNLGTFLFHNETKSILSDFLPQVTKYTEEEIKVFLNSNQNV